MVLDGLLKTETQSRIPVNDHLFALLDGPSRPFQRIMGLEESDQKPRPPSAGETSQRAADGGRSLHVIPVQAVFPPGGFS
jgi:hypothetical protein